MPSLLSPLAIDTINTNQTIRDGDTLLSSAGIFELGFFSPGNSRNRYVGIWYTNLSSTVVWVANRETPLTNSSAGVLKLGEAGNLEIQNEDNVIIWSTITNTNSTSNSTAQPPVAQLLDSGNLVIRDANDDDPINFLWQSFEYPTDTFLPGMKLGRNLMTNLEVYLSSWKSNDDPSSGNYTYHCDPTGYPQNILRRGEVKLYRSGQWQWDDLRFSGTPFLRENPIFRFGLVVDSDQVYFYYELLNTSVIARFTVSPGGVGQWLTWDEQRNDWLFYLIEPTDQCGVYNICGAYGICRIGNFPMCGCLVNFVPRDQDSWDRGDWSGGCVRKTSLNCEGDVFYNYSGIKLPDPQFSWFNDDIITLQECRAQCLRNCSCVAYTRLDIRQGGTGCLIYYGDLMDMKNLPQGGQDLYIRTASSELGLYNGSRGKDSELPFFKLSEILKATDQFSISNKLGEGGFGPVYKGTLEDGEEIAVKRLSKTSAQGVDELKNEVILIAKLQHRNLVRLLGCCIQGDENMLLYEYMPNNSLDAILFGEHSYTVCLKRKMSGIQSITQYVLADETKSKSLDWRKRYHIINGIAKGLLYLHQDSRLRIIHRDLKASNILLDSDMNPKISDFGLARSFGGNETEAHTRRVVGTFGYMSPEYAVDGLFSVKSDVFSFGVLVLEVVSGKRNRGFFSSNHSLNLLGHAWTLYKEENSIELVDGSLGGSFDVSEVLRSIHVGLLCVQKCPEDRPSMSDVVFMLGNDVTLPQAKQPGFFTERDIFAAESLTNTNAANSVNEVTITLPDGR
ncbi:hypothetical protein DH2020_011366 [Rehmannia glutinosa]|uniref:Receptor-like serine/threonine-protein kinase n=1 Tax=Rehmannia glutinosa TaxID=99300 RepID=A0ABR0XD44_REHGL